MLREMMCGLVLTAAVQGAAVAGERYVVGQRPLFPYLSQQHKGQIAREVLDKVTSDIRAKNPSFKGVGPIDGTAEFQTLFMQRASEANDAAMRAGAKYQSPAGPREKKRFPTVEERRAAFAAKAQAEAAEKAAAEKSALERLRIAETWKIQTAKSLAPNGYAKTKVINGQIWGYSRNGYDYYSKPQPIEVWEKAGVPDLRFYVDDRGRLLNRVFGGAFSPTSDVAEDGSWRAGAGVGSTKRANPASADPSYPMRVNAADVTHDSWQANEGVGP